jgi:co-chaperonin GroES (HSP10)
MDTPFNALPGFLICKPFVSKDDTFISDKEVAGEPQISEVISVGGGYIDDHGNSRTPPVKLGDVILHRYTSDDLTIEFDKYRIVHFSNVLGLKSEKTKKK